MIAAPGTTDDALAVAAAAGDRDAFGRLYQRHVARVAGVCRRRVPTADVDDVVQEVFARGWQRLATLEDPALFGPWIRTIAVRAAADNARGSRRRHVALAPDLEVVDHTGPQPEDAALRHDVARRVADDLATLRPRDGEALWLRDALGTPVPDVASHFGMTEASTRVMLARARQRLRRVVRVVAGWLGALVVSRRPWLVASAGGAPTMVAAAGVYLVVTAGAAPPPPVPPSDESSPGGSVAVVQEPDDDREAAAGRGPVRATPLVGGGDTSADPGQGQAAPVTDPPAPAPTAIDGPVVERRPVDEDDADRLAYVRTPDGAASVSVHDGGVVAVVVEGTTAATLADPVGDPDG